MVAALEDRPADSIEAGIGLMLSHKLNYGSPMDLIHFSAWEEVSGTSKWMRSERQTQYECTSNV